MTSNNESLLDVAGSKLTTSLTIVKNDTLQGHSGWRGAAETLLSLTKSVLDLSKNNHAADAMAATNLNKSVITPTPPPVPAPPPSQPITNPDQGIYQSAKEHITNTSIKFLDHTSEIVLKFLKLQKIHVKIGQKETSFVQDKLKEITQELEEIGGCVDKAKSAAAAKQEQKFLYFLREAMLKTQLIDQKMLKDGQHSIRKLIETKSYEAKMDALRALAIGGLSSLALGAGVYFAPHSLLHQTGPRSSYLKYWVGGGFAVICAIVTAANLTTQLRKLGQWQREWLGEFKEVKFQIMDEKLTMDNMRALYKCAVSDQDAKTCGASLLDNLEEIEKI